MTGGKDYWKNEEGTYKALYNRCIKKTTLGEGSFGDCRQAGRDAAILNYECPTCPQNQPTPTCSQCQGVKIIITICTRVVQGCTSFINSCCSPRADKQVQNTTLVR